MEQRTRVYMTILLALTAGYCDTVTFVSANNLFSAHVTGNFIVFAYDTMIHADTGGWLKLLAFPVFVAAVITGGDIAARSSSLRAILVIEGIILTVSGIIWTILSLAGVDGREWAGLSVAMCIIFSMGLQNAFGKIYSKETYGPTTMMTGNVTQAALDLSKLLKKGDADLMTKESLRHHAITISGFLSGCLLGAALGKIFGLAAVLMPGVTIIIYAMSKLGMELNTVNK
jgi:uncharacterized membrane protein YoaK (UPF0700 family)